MSLFKRPRSPYWYTEITVKGTRVSRSTGTTSRREAERFERELRDQLKSEAKGQAERTTSRLTLDQACGRYWTEHGYRLGDAKSITIWLRYIVAYLEQDLPLSDMSARHVTHLVSELRAAGKGDTTINRVVTCLQGVHNRAAKLWEEPVKVIDWRPHKTREQSRTTWLSRAQADALLAALPEPTRDIVFFILEMGLRRKEAFSLTWDQVSFDRNCVTIRAKGGVVRDVLLTDDALALLHRIPRERRTVFDTTNWRRRFEAAKQAIGVPELRWHDLRHTHATWLGQSGASLDLIKERLGHSSIAVTQKYRHVAGGEMRDALQKFTAQNPITGNVVALKRR